MKTGTECGGWQNYDNDMCDVYSQYLVYTHDQDKMYSNL